MTTNYRKLATAMFVAAMFIGLCIAQAGGQESTTVPQGKGGNPGASKNAGADKKDAKAGANGIKDNKDDALGGDAVSRLSDNLGKYERSGNSLDKKLRTVEDMILRLPMGPGQKKTHDDFRQFFIEYQIQGKGIAALEKDIRLVAPVLKKDLNNVGNDYEAVAADLDLQAKAEPLPEHQAQFVQLAKDARDNAATFRQAAKQVDDKVEKIIAGIARIQANVRVARAMERMLDVVPDLSRLQALDRTITLLEQNNKQMIDGIRAWRLYWDIQRGIVPPAAVPGAQPAVPFDPAVPPGLDPTPVVPKGNP